LCKGIVQWKKKVVESGINRLAVLWATIFTLKLTKKQVQTPSYEIPKTSQRILFLLIFSVDPNIAEICPIDWKDLKWRANTYRFLCFRGRFTTPLFRKEHYVKTMTQPYIDAVFANNYFIQIIEKRVRWAVLGLSHRIGSALIFMKISFKNLNSLKRDLSNNAIVSPPLFLLVNTF
jgi:hypothetical protein